MICANGVILYCDNLILVWRGVIMLLFAIKRFEIGVYFCGNGVDEIGNYHRLFNIIIFGCVDNERDATNRRIVLAYARMVLPY